MIKKYHTVLLFSETLDHYRKFRVSSILFKYLSLFGIVSFIVLSVVTGYFTHLYQIASREAREVAVLRVETRSQKVQIHKFVKKVNKFEKQMARMEKFDKKLHVITALDKAEKNSFNMSGIGGSNPMELYDISTPYNTNTLKKLSKKMETLEAQANLQEISFYQLDRFFKDRQSFLSSIPSIWPIKGWVTSGFGYRTSPYTGTREMHEGIDIATRMHSEIISPADGIIIRSGRNYSYGLVVEVDHGYGIITRFGHNSKNLVKVGDPVKRGQLMAYSGNTGRSTGPHLHYEVILNGIPVNPMKYIFE